MEQFYHLAHAFMHQYLATLSDPKMVFMVYVVLLTFLVLEAVGYQAKEGVVNTPQAIHNLELAYLIGPIVFVMLGGACMIGYGLDA